MPAAATYAGDDVAVSAASRGSGPGPTVHLEFAGWRLRLAARAIDAVILVGVYWFLEALDVVPPAYYSSLVTGDTLDMGIVSLLRTIVVVPLVTLAVWLVFEAVPTAARGRTVGKLIVGLKVLRADTCSEPGLGKSLGRWVVPAVPLVVLGSRFGILLTALVYASVVWNKQRQGWHDKAAGTVVVHAGRRDRRHPAGLQEEPPDEPQQWATPPERTAGLSPPVTFKAPPDLGDDDAAAHTAAADPALGEVFTGSTTLKTGQQVPLASPSRRLAARAVDWAVGAFAWIVISMLSNPWAPGGHPITRFYTAFAVGALIVLGLGVCYEIAMIAWRGQTVGKAVAGVRVVRAADGMDPGAMRAALRWLVVAAPRLPLVLALTLGGETVEAAALLLVWVLWPIVYVSLLWGRDHQGWHDKAAGTLVVRERAALVGDRRGTAD